MKSEYPSSGRKIDNALYSRQYAQAMAVSDYLIELKYIRKTDASEKVVETVKDQAVAQMNEYLQLDEFRSNDRIKGLIYVVVKDEIVCFERLGQGCTFPQGFHPDQ